MEPNGALRSLGSRANSSSPNLVLTSYSGHDESLFEFREELDASSSSSEWCPLEPCETSRFLVLL